MKMNKGLTLVLCLLVATLFVAPAFAQETTAGMQGIVKDASGAVVSGATVEVSSSALLGVKKAETDASGYYRFANLPLGTYTVTVSAKNFKTVKQSNITLAAGSLPTIDLKLEVGGVEQVVEVSSAAPIVDVATSKVQTNITEDVLAAVPKGRSFQSVIQFAPGARNEPLQGGYQIDGASNSENAYLVEGQETASVQDGHSAANVPMEFIQEVQVKSSGFEAEFGGALGGVVNVVQKRGSNAWHGSLFTNYSSDMFNAAPNRTLRYVPGTAPANGGDQPTEYYQPKKDHSKTISPGYEVGGYLLKDRVWLFSSFVPEMYTLRRNVNFNVTGGPNKTPFTGPRDFNTSINTYYALNRIDYLLTQKIRVYGAMQYGYARGEGTTLPGADDVFGKQNLSAGTHPDNFNGGIGYVAPNSIYNFGADVTLTPNIVATTRYGYFFQNYGDRGLGVGTRYYYRNTNYNYGTTTASADLTKDLYANLTGVAGYGNRSLDGNHLNTITNGGFVNSTNFFNIPNNANTFFDAYKRYSFNQDLAWFKKTSFGTHNFKFGYAFNRANNNVLNYFNTSQVYVTYNSSSATYCTEPDANGDYVCNTQANMPVGSVNHPRGGTQAWYYPNTLAGYNQCGNILAQNLAWYGVWGGSPDSSACTGNWGTVNVRDLQTRGQVGGMNHALYAQDAWTLGRGITLNLGVRADKETLPSYFSGFKGISFGFGQKVAPRLGASWDVFGTGKLKVYGSFGYFFDIMKYNLPRGSFGGDYWHDCVYALDTPDYTLFKPTPDANGHYCPTGGQVGAVGPQPVATTASFVGVGAPGANAQGYIVTPGVRFIENFDFRQPSNDPNSPGSLGATGLVDPNLKPMKQHEMVIGADWAISPSLAFETRYSRKRLDRTIEDTGVITQDGETFYITNPGEGPDLRVPSYDCTNCPINPKAVRNYDGVEFRLTRRPVGKWFGSLSYTYSRLYGNYSGLTATDVSDGGGARNGANTDRAFDEPFMQFDAHGKAIDGPLATDRPHTFKAYGYYKLKWFGHETLLGGYQQWYSGTPLSSYMSIWGAPVFVEGRGKYVEMTHDATGAWVKGAVSERRTPQYSQTDLSLVQDFHVSKSNEKLVLGFEGNVTNLFNQHSVTLIGQNLVRTGSTNPYPCTAAGNTCPATNLSGIDYAKVMSGFNYAATATTGGRIVNSQYGLPFGWQTGRAMRFKLRFSF